MVTSADSTTLADSAMSASDLILLQSNPLGLTTTLEDIVENFEFLDDWE
jgi:hypothetical protein